MNNTFFIETQEHRRFAEFCDACRQYRYIGLCYGVPGVGKTLSAEQYTSWRQLQELADLKRNELSVSKQTFAKRAVLYTVRVAASPGQINREIQQERNQLNYVLLATRPLQTFSPQWRHGSQDLVELIILDEADRLSTNALEQVRDIYDRSSIGVVLIGMPGLEKRLSRYAQLYSRIGFVHHFRPLTHEEMKRILPQMWQSIHPHNHHFSDEILKMVMRITSGNFRLMNRLLSQVERIIEINKLSSITPEVVETARESLIIGVT